MHCIFRVFLSLRLQQKSVIVGDHSVELPPLLQGDTLLRFVTSTQPYTHQCRNIYFSVFNNRQLHFFTHPMDLAYLCALAPSMARGFFRISLILHE